MQGSLEDRIYACEIESARLRKLVFRQNILWAIVLLLIGEAQWLMPAFTMQLSAQSRQAKSQL
jgi:hypothetical protein